MPTKTESDVMAVLIRDLAEQFDVELLELQATDLGVTALLRVRAFGPGGFSTSAAKAAGEKPSRPDQP